MALVPYNLTIPAQSPALLFAPYRDGNMAGGWNSSGADSDDGKFRTSFIGATASISWTGTAIYLLGQAAPGSYTTSLDGASDIPGSPNADEDLLASYVGLTQGDHTLQLSITDAQEVDISAAIITVGIVSEDNSTTVQNVTFNAVDVSGNSTKPDSFFQTEGPWNVLAPAGQNLNQPTLQNSEPGGQVAFNVSNASGFIVHGNLGVHHGTYNVSVTGPHGRLTLFPEQYNGSSPSEVQNNIIYFRTGLNPNATYAVIVDNTGSEAAPVFDVIDVVVLGPSSGSGTGSLLVSTAKMGMGMVVGLAVGLTLAVLVALASALFWLRSRHLERYRGTRPAIGNFVDSEKSDRTTFDRAVGRERAHVINPFVFPSGPTRVDSSWLGRRNLQ